jgi:hypothetical protein
MWHNDIGGSGGATATKSAEVSVGALTAGVDKSIAHGLTGCTKFNFIVRTSTNQALVSECCKDPAFPTTKFIINSAVDIASGILSVIVQGFN